MIATPSNRARTDTKANNADRRILYPFDPPPKLLHDLIRAKVLKTRDQAVLVELLRWRFHFQDSCWVAKATIARNLQCSDRTVQRSLDRLQAAGLIRRVDVSLPGHTDPDDPRNHTGSRIYFLWITTNPSSHGPAPERRTADRPNKPIDPCQGETFLSPPPGTILSPPGETELSPNLSLEVSLDSKKTTTTPRDSSAQEPTDIHAFSGSSSSFASLPPNSERGPAQLSAAGLSAPVPTPEIPTADASTQPVISPVGPAAPLPSSVARVEPVAVSHSPAVVPSSPAVVHPRVGTVEVTPTVPARALGLPTEGLDQALLTALVARVVRLSSGFKVGANWTTQQARDAILGLLRSLGCPLWWISNALDQAERHPRARVGNKPVESWGFIRQVVSNWLHGDGTPGSPPVSKVGSPPGVPSPGGPSRDGKPSRPPPASADVAIDADLRELSGEQLRESIAELEASLSQLESARRSRMWEFLRTKLSQARSEQSARGGGP
jgi:hypothetical protein